MIVCLPHTRRIALLGVLLGVLLAAMLTLTAEPAAAHAQLESTDPAGGATVERLPDSVILRFSEDVESDFAQVQVRGPSGDRVDAGAPAVDGAVVTTQLRPDGPAGTYAVAFRVVSADGHPIESMFSFDVTSAGAPAGTEPPTAAPAPTETAASDSATSDPAPTETEDGAAATATSPPEEVTTDPATLFPEATPSPEATLLAGAGEDSDGSTALVLLVLAVVLAAVVGGGVLLQRRAAEGE